MPIKIDVTNDDLKLYGGVIKFHHDPGSRKSGTSKTDHWGF